MSTYYKYAEQSADSQVNWADVSKSVSEMLDAEVKIREEKKAAYEQSFQKLNDTLANPIQGQWQDGNKFVNDAAHDLSQQSLMNYRLFKSGKMSERDYTLSMQNLKSGTNTLFNLKTSFDAAYKDRVDGLLSGKYQAATGANMQQVEGFKNFSVSKAIIDPYTNQLSIGIMAKNPTTGVMELTKNTMPVNVLMGMIGTPIPTWDADGAINGAIEKMGKIEEVIYNAASSMRAGSITKLLGLGALQGEYAKKGKDGKPLYPEFADSLENINKGINDTIDSFFSNTNNITSVLTQNTKKYNQDSYTFDKDIAAKDKTKILRRLDETTGLPVLDTSAPHYKEQEQEARDWVKGQMLFKMDSKRDMTTTGYAPAPQRVGGSGSGGGKEGEKDKVAAAGAWNGLYTGKTASEKRDAADILLGTPLAKKEGLLKIDLTDDENVTLIYSNPKKNRTISMVDVDGNPISLDSFSSKGVELHGVADRRKAMAAGGGDGTYGRLDDYSSVFSEREGAIERPKPINIPVDIFSIPSQKSTKLIKSVLPKGFLAEDNGGVFGNDVIITAPNGKKYKYNSKQRESERNAEKLLLEKFITNNSVVNNNSGSRKKAPSTTTTVGGGRVRQ